MLAPQDGQAFQLLSTALPQAGQVRFRFFPQPGHFSGPALPPALSVRRLTGVSLRTMANR